MEATSVQRIGSPHENSSEQNTVLSSVVDFFAFSSVGNAVALASNTGFPGIWSVTWRGLGGLGCRGLESNQV